LNSALATFSDSFIFFFASSRISFALSNSDLASLAALMALANAFAAEAAADAMSSSAFAVEAATTASSYFDLAIVSSFIAFAVKAAISIGFIL
jgi:hypothetical protein